MSALVLSIRGANRLRATCLNQHHISQRHTPPSAQCVCVCVVVKQEGLQVITHLSDTTEQPGEERRDETERVMEESTEDTLGDKKISSAGKKGTFLQKR